MYILKMLYSTDANLVAQKMPSTFITIERGIHFFVIYLIIT